MLFSFLYTTHPLLFSIGFDFQSFAKSGSARRTGIPRNFYGSVIMKASRPILELNSNSTQLSQLNYSLYISGTVTKTGNETQEYFGIGPDRMKFNLDGSRLKANFAALQIKPEI